ncbi:MAG: hypothetical protein R3B45_13250 [Bdellovibrionota bacterium]
MENKTKFNTGNFLVMVSFEENSKLNSFLKSSDATIFINPPTSNDAGNALVKIQDEDFLEKLSNLAHNSSGLSCGNIEVLSSFPLTNTISSIIAPEYQTTLALNDVISLLKLPDSNAIKARSKPYKIKVVAIIIIPKDFKPPHW